MELYLDVTSFDEQLFKGKVNKVLLPEHWVHLRFYPITLRLYRL